MRCNGATFVMSKGHREAAVYRPGICTACLHKVGAFAESDMTPAAVMVGGVVSCERFANVRGHVETIDGASDECAPYDVVCAQKGKE